MGQLERFQNWLKTPHGKEVYGLFVKYADTLREKGIDKCAFALIINRVRWEMKLQAEYEGFKISNNYAPLMARHLALSDPAYRHFFNFHHDDADAETVAA